MADRPWERDNRVNWRRNPIEAVMRDWSIFVKAGAKENA
jgi:hypothetical protein